MMKKMVAIILACAITLGMSMNSLAYTKDMRKTDESEFQLYSIDRDVVYVDDENGNLVEVLLEERTYIPSKGDVMTADYKAEYPVGTRKAYTATITNAQLGFPSTVGSLLTNTAKNKLSKLAGSAIKKKLTNDVIPGVSLVANIAAAIAAVNAFFGNNGFKVTVTLEYDEYFSQREGYSIWGWDFKGASLKSY